MTYFSVLVATTDLAALDESVAPFDSFCEVAAYRRYVEPYELTAARVWARQNEGEVPGVDPDALDDSAGQAMLLSRFLDEEVLTELVDGLPTYYTIKTKNPSGELTSWKIGGGFSHTFKPRDPSRRSVVCGKIRCDHVPDHRQDWVDGGVKEALDLAGTRQAAVDAAAELYDRYDEIRAAHPPAVGWSRFSAPSDRTENYSIERAQDEYHAQPLVRALAEANIGSIMECPIDAFAIGRDAFVALHREGAIPGAALITLDSQWLAAGEIGMFGTSTATEGATALFRQHTNAYVDALPDDAWLITIECHN